MKNTVLKTLAALLALTLALSAFAFSAVSCGKKDTDQNGGTDTGDAPGNNTGTAPGTDIPGVPGSDPGTTPGTDPGNGGDGDNNVTGDDHSETEEPEEYVHRYHVFGEWENTVPPTCTEAGRRVRNCLNCDYTEECAAEATGHEYDEAWSVNDEFHWLEPICSDTEEPSCRQPHDYVLDRVLIVATDVADVTDGTHVTNGTIGADGKAILICSVCGHLYTKTIPAGSHTLVLREAVAPTCLEPGNIAYYECLGCGKLFADENSASDTDTTSDTDVTSDIDVTSDTDNTPDTDVTSDTDDTSVTADTSVTDALDPKTVIIPPLGHSAPDGYEVSADVHIKRCAACAEVLESAAHEPSDGICTVCGAAAIDYTHGLHYVVSDDGLSLRIAGMGSAVGTQIVIPSRLGGLPVTGIGRAAFADRKEIVSVLIPDTVTEIDIEAFKGCISLTTVNVTENVRFIGNGAFIGCPSLVYETEGGVKYLGAWAMGVEDKGAVSVTVRAGTVGINYAAFSECRSLKELILPEGLKVIESYAFLGCGALRDITLPGTLTDIGEKAFLGCGLTDIVIPLATVGAGKSVFLGCVSLRGIYFEADSIPDGFDTDWALDVPANHYVRSRWEYAEE